MNTDGGVFIEGGALFRNYSSKGKLSVSNLDFSLRIHTRQLKTHLTSGKVFVDAHISFDARIHSVLVAK